MPAHQLEWMNADREARRAVVGEHALPHRGLRQLRRLDCRIERQCKLALVAARAGDRLRAWHEAELPQQPASRDSEAVARARLHERRQLVAAQPNALCEVSNRRKRSAPLSLVHESLCRVFGQTLDIRKPDTNGAAFQRAARSAERDIGKPKPENATSLS